MFASGSFALRMTASSAQVEFISGGSEQSQFLAFEAAAFGVLMSHFGAGDQGLSAAQGSIDWHMDMVSAPATATRAIRQHLRHLCNA